MIKAIITCFFIIKIASAFSCEDFTSVKSQDQLERKLRSLVQKQTNKIWTLKNRHHIGSTLNSCSFKDNSNGLVITFAGTGSFNPRTYHLMSDLIRCDSTQSLPVWMKENIYYLLRKILKEKKSNYTKWSGIEAGPLKLILKNSELSKDFRNYDFNVFASEESELLAGLENINLSNISKVFYEIQQSVTGNPQGIKQAVACTYRYFNEAKSSGAMPKLIILSHSSGARSSVKYLEKIKGIKANLVLSIDPVKEAQHAMGEVLEQLPSYILGKEVNVWSRKQPESLYKTSNSNRWINFYQNVDSNGLDLPIKFGIHGSPIHDADRNVFIKGLGAKAHGEITYDPSVLKAIQDELQAL